MPLEFILFHGALLEKWLYKLLVLKGYVQVSVFKWISDLMYKWTVVSEGDPLFLLLCLCGCSLCFLCFEH